MQKQKKKADELGLSGFVKNENNGDVYIEAEGEENILNMLVEWCHYGPDKAVVVKVILKETEVRNFLKFNLLRQ